MTKFCKKCRKTKSLNEFGKAKEKPGGIRPECKVCSKKTKTKWRKDNPKKWDGYQKKKSQTLNARFYNGKYGARARGLSWELSQKQYKEIVSTKTCHYCAGSLPLTGSGLDRKDNYIGYLADNVVPCCRSCNEIKGANLTYHEMTQVIKLIKKIRAKQINDLTKALQCSSIPGTLRGGDVLLIEDLAPIMKKVTYSNRWLKQFQKV